MGKAHSNKGRLFKFNTKEELERFVSLYEDLFTAYSEDTIKCNGKYYDGAVSDLRRGFERLPWWGEKNLLMVNLIKENLDEILKGGCFTKEFISRGRYMYVMR